MEKLVKKINRIPSYAMEAQYIVARIGSNHELFFYGAWDDEEKATRVAEDIDGIVVAHEDIEF